MKTKLTVQIQVGMCNEIGLEIKEGQREVYCGESILSSDFHLLFTCWVLFMLPAVSQSGGGVGEGWGMCGSVGPGLGTISSSGCVRGTL